jgi:hypothetical protein
MRWASALLLILACSACSGDNRLTSPTSPGASPPVRLPSSVSSANSRAFLWVMVVTDTGSCLPDATVELWQGTTSQSTPQVTPCGVWDSDGGAVFTDLPSGVEVTVRSSVAGYAAADKTVTTSRGGQYAVILTPARIQ